MIEIRVYSHVVASRHLHNHDSAKRKKSSRKAFTKPKDSYNSSVKRKLKLDKSGSSVKSAVDRS